MSDQKMPGEKGVWLLEKARQLRPQILRILATAYTDMDAAIQAVNTGAIFRYITKPWDPVELVQTLKRGLDFFMVQAERDQLLKEKQTLERERMIASRVVSLGLVSAGLNHHIGNRLATVNTTLELIETGAIDQELLQKSRADVQDILGLLHDLQLAANDRSADLHGDELRLSEIIAALLERLQPALAARKIVVENQIAASLPAFQADRAQFRRLLELLFKYELALLPGGSVIRLTAAESSVNGRPGLAITIQDNGPTLPQDTLRLVLDPLVIRGQPSEYSINLMVCFFILHHHGGSLEITGLAGGGNQFFIRLPLQPAPAAAVDDTWLLEKVLRNDQLWNRLIAGR